MRGTKTAALQAKTVAAQERLANEQTKLVAAEQATAAAVAGQVEVMRAQLQALMEHQRRNEAHNERTLAALMRAAEAQEFASKAQERVAWMQGIEKDRALIGDLRATMLQTINRVEHFVGKWDLRDAPAILTRFEQFVSDDMANVDRWLIESEALQNTLACEEPDHALAREGRRLRLAQISQGVMVARMKLNGIEDDAGRSAPPFGNYDIPSPL